MSIKESNEVTIKVIDTKENFIKLLTSKGFKEGRKFSLDDYYFIPNNINIDNYLQEKYYQRQLLLEILPLKIK